MRLEARAKINWSLSVLGRREDGYHLMDMVMQPVSLADTLTLTPAEEIRLTVRGGGSDLPGDERNLCWRAAETLRSLTGRQEGVAITLEKRIPSQAGLGGGSADCAAVLLGLNRLWELGLSQVQLEETGLALGADVPFCLRGGLCRVGGIGEKLQMLPEAPGWPLVIVKPCAGLSTGEIYRRFDSLTRPEPADTDAVITGLCAGQIRSGQVRLRNDLQPVSEALRPEIGEACRRLVQCGAAAALMSGSGSAVFGVFETAGQAAAAAASLRAIWPEVWQCETCRESVVFLSGETADEPDGPVF